MKTTTKLTFALAVSAGAALTSAGAYAKPVGGSVGGHPIAPMHAAPRFMASRSVVHAPGVHRNTPHIVQNHVIYNGGNFERHHHHHRRHFGYAYPLYAYDTYSNSCYWLWERYLDTGNPKWKHRYYDCIE